MNANPFSSRLLQGQPLPVKRLSRSIQAALKEAYRIHGGDKFTRQATKRYLR